MEAIHAILDFLEAVFQNTETRASPGVKNLPAKAEDGFSPSSGKIQRVSELPSLSTVVEPGRAQGLQPLSPRAHPESFVRFGMVDEGVGGVGSVVQVHDASVAPDGQHVTMALTVTINEFEGFINWGSPINALLMTQEGTNSMAMALSENLILKPIFKRKMENTKVTVGSGSVVVIGGLKEARSVKFEDKLPVLGDLPMVGRLFRSAGENKVRKALLMFVKVDIVDPTGRTLGTGERPSDVTN